MGGRLANRFGFNEAPIHEHCRNVFVERLWRSVKYERMYLKAYDSVGAARADIADYLGWYNSARAHSSLADFTPDQHYFAKLPAQALAA